MNNEKMLEAYQKCVNRIEDFLEYNYVHYSKPVVKQEIMEYIDELVKNISEEDELMDIEEVIKNLEAHNRWRRGLIDEQMSSNLIGVTIDFAIKYLLSFRDQIQEKKEV